jgi:hypothetical protein
MIPATQSRPDGHGEVRLLPSLRRPRPEEITMHECHGCEFITDDGQELEDHLDKFNHR